MSSTRNTDALANMNNGGSGEFHARIERDEPLTTHGVRLTTESLSYLAIMLTCSVT